MKDFIDDWGEAMLGPLTEVFLSETTTGNGSSGINSGNDVEGLAELWLRLSKIRDSMHDLEASRTKVELARQAAVHQSNPDSIAHVLGKVRCLFRRLSLEALMQRLQPHDCLK